MNFAFSGLTNRQPVFPAHGGGGGRWGANGQGATVTINGLTIQLSMNGLTSLLGGLQSGNLSVSSLSVNDITEEGTGSEPTVDEPPNPNATPLEGVTIEGKRMNWFQKAINWVDEKLESAVSSVTLTVTGVVMPLINRLNTIAHEGFHEGSARNPENKVSWAVPYEIKDWKFVRQDQMMTKNNLSWEDGKKVMKSTTETLFLIIPIKHHIPVPGAPPFIQKGIDWGAGSGTKSLFKEGVYHWLED